MVRSDFLAPRGARILLALVIAALGAAPVAADDAVKRGKYLARIMDCGGCHTPGALVGQPDEARYLAGSDVGFFIPDLGYFYPPNLTPDRESGLGLWSAAEIVAAIRTGARPDGRELAPIMAWRSYAAMTDADALALAAFLQSLPPVSHPVPQPTGAGEKAPGPYMTVVAPQ